MTSNAARVIKELFAVFMEEPECLPKNWRTSFTKMTETRNRARVVSDYISGMTDRYALDEHRRLYSSYEKDEYLQ